MSDDDADGAPDDGPERADPRGWSGAISAETIVRREAGRWVVDIVVIFPDGVVRRTVGDHPTRRRAEIAAAWIKRGAERDIPGPNDGAGPSDD